MAATVDMISNGRLDFGIGAAWSEYEHQSMGIPFYTVGERIRRLGEACELTKRLWIQPLTDFEGRYYQLKDARCEPKPIQKRGCGYAHLAAVCLVRYAPPNLPTRPISRERRIASGDRSIPDQGIARVASSAGQG